jgi:hypothetical protein
MFYKAVLYEISWTYWLAILAIKASDKNSENFSGLVNFSVLLRISPALLSLSKELN